MTLQGEQYVVGPKNLDCALVVIIECILIVRGHSCALRNNGCQGLCAFRENCSTNQMLDVIRVCCCCSTLPGAVQRWGAEWICIWAELWLLR